MSSYFAGYQELKWFDRQRKRVLLSAMWYPTYQAERDVTYLMHFSSRVSVNAPFLAGQFPFIMLSHGSGGHRYNQHYLAEALARTGYLVMAIEHMGDTIFNDKLSESNANHIERINDILFVYQEAIHSAVIGKYIKPQSVVHIGHSFGGFSSYILAGGLSSLIPSAVNKDIEAIFQNVLRCIVMLAPALSETLLDQQEKLPMPTLLVTAEQDELLGASPRNYLNYFSHGEAIHLANSGHFVFLMPFPESLVAQHLEVAYDDGEPRASVHLRLIESIKTFLNKHVNDGNSYEDIGVL